MYERYLLKDISDLEAWVRMVIFVVYLLKRGMPRWVFKQFSFRL
jgi:hypothetical protein